MRSKGSGKRSRALRGREVNNGRGRAARRKTVLSTQKVRRVKRWSHPYTFLKSIGFSFVKFSVFGMILGMVSLFFIYSYQYFMEAPFLELREVDIRCHDQNLARWVRQICQFPKRTTVVAIDIERLKREIEKNPWVRCAVVERRFPHTLRVEVEKHQPIAFVVVKPKLYLMSDQGVLFKEVSKDEGLDLPVVTGLFDDTYQISGGDTEQEKDLRTVLTMIKIMNGWSKQWSVERLSEIHARGRGRFSLYFDHLRAEVRLNTGDLRLQLKRLSQVVDYLASKGVLDTVKRIDLQGPGGAVVSFKSPLSPTRRG